MASGIEASLPLAAYVADETQRRAMSCVDTSHLLRGYGPAYVNQPPSTTRTWPVTYEARSDDR